MLYEGEIIKIFPETDKESYINWIVDEGFTYRVYSDHIVVGARNKQRSFKPMLFAELIKDKRTTKGWNRYKLGRILNVSETAIFNWEIGRTQPKSKRLKELIEVLDISQEELEKCRI